MSKQMITYISSREFSLKMYKVKYRKILIFLKDHILIVFFWLTFELRLSKRKISTSSRSRYCAMLIGSFFCFVFFEEFALSKGIKEFSHTHEHGVALLCLVLISCALFLMKPLWGDRVAELSVTLS